MKKKLSLFLVLSLTMSLLFGMSVFADDDSGNGGDADGNIQYHVKLSTNSLTLRQGDEGWITMSADCPVDVYDDGCGIGTYAEIEPEGAGTYTVYINISNSEPAGMVYFCFYEPYDQGYGLLAQLNVTVLQRTDPSPAPSPTPSPSPAPSQPSQPSYLDTVKAQFPYGFEFVNCSNFTQAIVVLDSTRTVGKLFQCGVPLATYYVIDATGIAYPQVFTSQIGYFGQTYVGVNVANLFGRPLTIRIDAASKAQFLARGIYGLYLNNTLVPWP